MNQIPGPQAIVPPPVRNFVPPHRDPKRFINFTHDHRFRKWASLQGLRFRLVLQLGRAPIAPPSREECEAFIMQALLGVHAMQ